MSQIIGIACVYGVTVSYTDLLLNLDLDLDLTLHLNLDLDLDLKSITKYLPTGLNVFSHPEWDDDTVIIGINIITLDVDPSREGSTMAPVITLPDITDFREFTLDKPMYYQVPIYEYTC
jgi:hypothetical protein